MVADYIRRLEQCYQLVYGRDKLTMETKEGISYGQLQAGLNYHILKCAAVSANHIMDFVQQLRQRRNISLNYIVSNSTTDILNHHKIKNLSNQQPQPEQPAATT